MISLNMALKACQWGGIEVTVAQHTNGFQTIANNGGYLKRYMVEQIVIEMEDVQFTNTEADPVRVLLSSNGNDYAGSLARGYYVWCNNDL